MKFTLTKLELKNGLKLPDKMCNNLAELMGIHFGDGCMQNKFNNTYKVYYSFNSRDREYVDYVSNLFYSLFNIKLKSEENEKKNTVGLYFYSKTLCTFFNKKLKIPYSPKNNLRIPRHIFNNKTHLAFFIRGLFDTDGCNTIQRTGKYRYLLIKITTKLRYFAEDIKFALSYLDIKSYICNKGDSYEVVVRNKDSLKKFMAVIKSKNKKGNVWGCWDLKF